VSEEVKYVSGKTNHVKDLPLKTSIKSKSTTNGSAQWFSTWGREPHLEGSRVDNSYIAVSHLLYSRFRWGSLGYSGCYNGSRYKKVKNHWSSTTPHQRWTNN